MGCRTFAEMFVGAVSVIILILSVIIIGFASATIARVGDEFEQLDQNSPPVVAIFFGAALFLFSLCGAFGAFKDMKILLFIFVIGCGVLSIGIIAIGAVLLTQTGEFENVENLENLDSAVEDRLLTFELAIFAACCRDAETADDLGAQEVKCIFNDVEIEQPCVSNDELFADFLDFFGGEDAATCKFLRDVEVDGKNIVGDTLGVEDHCGNRFEFIDAVTGFFKDNVVTLGVTNLVIGIIMFLLMTFSCVLMCTAKDDDRK